jgi:cyclase
VLSLDVKRVDGQFRLFAKGGRVDTGLDAIEFASLGEKNGAGELVINSIDTDGVKKGFDIEMLTAFSSAVNLPIIASGGAGKKEDFIELFKLKKVDAGLAASIFHFGEVDIIDLKKTLKDKSVSVRI